MGQVTKGRDDALDAKRRRKTAEQSNRASRVNFGDMAFVEVRLNSLESAAYDREPLAPSEIFEGLCSLVFEGYKVSLTRDFEHDCFICSLSCVHRQMDNSGFVLVTRGSSVEDACGLALFKHHTVLLGDWKGAQEAQRLNMRG